ncbi:MAG: hypothetical protein H6852_15995 [Geminicoccaceae bacterium]|nr:hypothetical protein [Geminicoccaceae bacterium]MCB9969121.1 hypothetical protein [Geminicoccaceae bacterium]HRY27234.1 hypothetical protein [Geminicoccaceae bacterium]
MPGRKPAAGSLGNFAFWSAPAPGKFRKIDKNIFFFKILRAPGFVGARPGSFVDSLGSFVDSLGSIVDSAGSFVGRCCIFRDIPGPDVAIDATIRHRMSRYTRQPKEKCRVYRDNPGILAHRLQQAAGMADTVPVDGPDRATGHRDGGPLDRRPPGAGIATIRLRRADRLDSAWKA